jgi:hypothetical protein
METRHWAVFAAIVVAALCLVASSIVAAADQGEG